MEALRILKKTMLGYRDSDPRKAKPLSIGVFGAPGAGKSFSVRELASGVFGDSSGDDYEGWMEFNLAQFKDNSDLIGALHQVRDRVLEGLIPVVFWDEFDAREYHWLQYLLAPMQDGKFQEGQITHPIGKCVFVFAGATAASFAQFGEFPNLTRDEAIKAKRDFALAKGPDFKSRLDASLDVLGPNPKPEPAAKGSAATSPFAADPFCPIRRAIFVRAQLGLKPDERLDFDSGLLTALLEIETFHHGSRSLEKLLAPLRAARKEGLPIRRSQLASPRHLAMYVDPEKFYALCRRDTPFRQDDIVREIAPAIHETWRDIARTQGWPTRHDTAYAELPPHMKWSNEAAARRMPDILALVGLRLERGDSAEDEAEVRQHLTTHLALLAEAEHDGWMDHLKSEGWRYGAVRNDEQRVHDCLIPYAELREQDREKDRESVRRYPDFARKAGWHLRFG
jgi:hypothetical protein